MLNHLAIAFLYCFIACYMLCRLLTCLTKLFPTPTFDVSSTWPLPYCACTSVCHILPSPRPETGDDYLVCDPGRHVHCELII